MNEFDVNIVYDDDDYNNSYREQIVEYEEDMKPYVILNEEEVRNRINNDISHVSLILSVPKEVARMVLLHFKWDVYKVHEAWFSNEESARKMVGLMNNGDDQVLQIHNLDESEVNCGICFDDHGFDMVKSLSCGHRFCTTCCKGYISSSINDGPGCLFLKCPVPKCGISVGEGFISEFASDAEKIKYRGYMFRSYVEGKKGMKWCPFPDCGNVVEYVVDSGSYDVTCSCSHSFCFNCTQELHRPVDCQTVEQWSLKNRSESENTMWILAYTKTCPKCKRSIEKNQGCNNMTCAEPCGHQFCWLCFQDWNKHDGASCNKFRNGKKLNSGEVIRKRAKKMLERYMHYYERFASNDKSREKALSDLTKMQSGLLKVIGEKNFQGKVYLAFIIEAWEQIIECRRVLKWTYAYGYYLAKEEPTKKQFFEYLQGEAEACLERLHRCAENELQDYYIEGRSPSIDFLLFRMNLIGLTKVTATYFENLVTALENGL